MRKSNKYTIALGFALLLLIISLILVFTGNGSKAGPLLIAFFITLSFAVKGFPSFKGLSFTMWMFTAVYNSHVFIPSILFLWAGSS